MTGMIQRGSNVIIYLLRRKMNEKCDEGGLKVTGMVWRGSSSQKGSNDSEGV